jgi:hypothetical protein
VHRVLVRYWFVVGVVFIFREGGFSENYLSLSLIDFIVDYTGTQHTYSCGRGCFLKNLSFICYVRGRILRELPLPSLWGFIGFGG